MRPPEAQIITANSRHAVVLCPYCGRQHKHDINLPGKQRRAPGCGLHRSPAQRLIGYVFTT